MTYALQAKTICKKYGRYKALDGVDIHVPEGAVYGVIGKNGAGKTTLLRVLCDLQRADSGEYFLFGISNYDKRISYQRHRVGAMIEAPSVYGELSALENLKLQAAAVGLPTDEELPEILKTVGLDGVGNKKARNFSLGMRQRLGIAVALVGGPDLIMLDEPVNGLDPQGIVEMRELILKLNRQCGITFMISSHILDELSKTATHYCFMDGGRVLCETSAKELEESLRKCTRVKVTDIKKLPEALDNMGLEYEILSESEANVFGEFSLTALVTTLAGSGCELISAAKKDESLEAFFIGLAGGGK